MKALIFPVIAGVLIAIQSIFNQKLSLKSGIWLTVTMVHLTGLIASLVCYAYFRNYNVSSLLSANKVFWLGGVLGVFIIGSVIQGITNLGPAYTFIVMIFCQVLAMFFIEKFGLFGFDKSPLKYTQILGIILMFIGVFLYRK